MLNRTRYPSEVIALVVFWGLRYRLTLRDLAEMFLIRGIVFSYEAVREWERSSRRFLLTSFVNGAITTGSSRAGTWTRLM